MALELENYARIRNHTLHATIWYPHGHDPADDDPSEPHAVEVSLMDVRAADDIRIVYDFERDGWVIMQATRVVWDVDEEPDDGWQEVAFVRAWGLTYNDPAWVASHDEHGFPLPLEPAP